MSDLCVRHLLREHREVEKALAELDALLEEQKKNSAWGPEQTEDFTWLMQTVDSHLLHHIRKEDEVLFPALEAFLPHDLGPLAVLRGEHSDMNEIYRRVRQAGEARARGNAGAEVLDTFLKFGSGLTQIVRDHIYKEDRVLFPMVTRFLSPERDAFLLQKMESIDRTRTPLPGRKSESAGQGRP